MSTYQRGKGCWRGGRFLAASLDSSRRRRPERTRGFHACDRCRCLDPERTHHKRKREMRQASMNTRVTALVAACTALLAACGGSDSSGGTVQSIDFAYPGPHYMLDAPVALKATASSGLPVTSTS